MRMTEREFESLKNKTTPKRNKFNAVATKVDGIRFDSLAEAAYYEALKLDPEVTHIDCHVPVTLTGGLRLSVDFIVWRLKVPEAVEIKGKETNEFKRMRKLFDAVHPLAPMLVLKRRYGGLGGWERI